MEADTASREFNTRTEWMLRKEVFHDIIRHFYVPEIDLFASRLNHQLPLFVSRQPDLGATAVDAFQLDWSQWTSFIHPPVVLLPGILQKVRDDKATALLVAPNWPSQRLVRSDSADADEQTIPPSQGEVSTVTAFRPRGSSHSAANSPRDCMADIGSAYQAAGFPEEVTNVLLASRSQSTKKRYQAPWRAWSHWCSSKGLCPFSAPVADVLTFLTELVTSRSLEYRTLAVYKSTISQEHLPVGQTRLGDLPVVSRFMKDIFRMKPPTPRLSSTWNVEGLLEFRATLDTPSDLTLKMLSLKLAALLALTSSARAHELVKLDLAFASIRSYSWEFTFAEHTKVSRPGHPTRKIYLTAYPDNPKICVVRALQEYRSRTEKRRQSSRLLISFVRPFKPISSQTMSRWLRKAMQLAGIACHFTGHSTRSASTSAAAQAGVPLESILIAADWSSSKTFKQFFLRSPDRGEFARAVLAVLPE